MKIKQKNLVFTLKTTHLDNIEMQDKDALESYLQTCEESFCFALYASDNCSIVYNIIDIDNLQEFLQDADDEIWEALTQRQHDLLQELCIFAKKNNINEIHF